MLDPPRARAAAARHPDGCRQRERHRELGLEELGCRRRPERRRPPAGLDRRLPVRAQGVADPRRAARVRPLAGRRRSASIRWSPSRVCRRGARRGEHDDGLHRGARARALLRPRRRRIDTARRRTSAARRGEGARPTCFARADASERGARGRHARAARAATRARCSRGESRGAARRARHVVARIRARGCARARSPAARAELAGPACAASTAASCSRGRAVRRRAGGSTCCPPGRNFYSVDVRAVPTPGGVSACAGARGERLVQRHVQRSRRVSALHRPLGLGHRHDAHGRRRHRAGARAARRARPVWAEGSGRVVDTEILPASVLRPAARGRRAAHLGLLPRRAFRI